MQNENFFFENDKGEKTIADIEYIACGVDHMLAISRYTGDKGSGMTFAWGKNHKGQLGIGSKEYCQYEPQMIKNTKERFVKVACGHNYSLGLT